MKHREKNIIDPHKRWWDILSAFLLLVAMLTAATRLVATEWAEDLGRVQTVAFFAVMAGLALGQSRFSPRLSFIFATVYGLYTVSWQLGSAIGEGVAWSERLLSMWGRLQIILADVFAREVIKDNLLFLVLISVLFWLLGAYGGYHLTRWADAWRAVLPGGVAIFVIHAYDAGISGRTWYLAIYIFLGLLLLARLAYLRQRQEWEGAHTHIPADVGFDLTRFAVVTTALIVIFAWNAPRVDRTINVLEVLNQRYLSFQDKFSYLFQGLRPRGGVIYDRYGDLQTLGLGASLRSTAVMAITGPRNPPEGSRYYWRARVYDQYAKGQWLNSLDTQAVYTPEDRNFPLPDSSARQEAAFEVRTLVGTVSMIGPAQPLWFSRPGSIFYNLNPDGSIDLSAVRADPVIRPGETYKTRALLSTVTQRQLRQAGTDYPDWVVERYLQLPAEITPRTRELAQQIAAGYDNPYDITQAVTLWLRNNIEYTEAIRTPPSQQEVMDWFLFDYRQGFCNYYATAEIIMLRSLGIPARWAVGYAQGERQMDAADEPGIDEENLPAGVDPGLGTYVVRERDAHSWPEVYFPGVGWIEFEPTVSQSLLLRPLGEPRDTAEITPVRPNTLPELEPEETPEPESPLEVTPAETFRLQRSWLVPVMLMVGAIGLTLFAVFGWRKRTLFPTFWVRIAGADPILLKQLNVENASFFDYLRVGWALWLGRLERRLRRWGVRLPAGAHFWLQRALLPGIAQAYQEINDALERLGAASMPADATPAERAAHLIELLPESQPAVNGLLDDYQVAVYAERPINLPIARKAAGQVRKLSWQARLRRWWQRMRQILRIP